MTKNLNSLCILKVSIKYDVRTLKQCFSKGKIPCGPRVDIVKYHVLKQCFSICLLATPIPISEWRGCVVFNIKSTRM